MLKLMTLVIVIKMCCFKLLTHGNLLWYNGEPKQQLCRSCMVYVYTFGQTAKLSSYNRDPP